MSRNKNLRFLALVAACFGFGAGCDPLVATTYEGESQLALRVVVQNGETSSSDSIVPALGYLDGTNLRFSKVAVRGEFPAAFEVNVFDPPRGELLTPLDPVLSYRSAIAIEFLAAVPKPMLDASIALAPTAAAPSDEVCWNGSCDELPTSKLEPEPEECDPSDSGCTPGIEACRDEECEEEDRLLLPDPLRSIYGFESRHVILYTRKALAKNSWEAQRLGAPKGLAAGYHLAQLRDPDLEEYSDWSACITTSRDKVLEEFRAQSDVPLDLDTIKCFVGETVDCRVSALPRGDDARLLADLLAQAEVDEGCLLLAVDIVPVPDPSEQTLTIRIGDRFPKMSIGGSVKLEGE